MTKKFTRIITMTWCFLLSTKSCNRTCETIGSRQRWFFLRWCFCFTRKERLICIKKFYPLSNEIFTLVWNYHHLDHHLIFVLLLYLKSMMMINNVHEYYVVDSVDNDTDVHVYEMMIIYHFDREKHLFDRDYHYLNQIDDEVDLSYEQEILE